MKKKRPEIVYEVFAHEYESKRKVEPEGLEEIPYDKAAFARTDIGYRRRELDSIYRVYHDTPMHPNLLNYWGGMGLKKELFDDEGKSGFDARHAYSVFTPLNMDPGKKYAAVYVCHGGGQPIEWAETYGFNTLAAVERYIVVYAQNGGQLNDEVDTEFPRIIQELKDKGYPIDEERIYVVGFSSGGGAAVAAACTCPDLAAAIAVMPGGQPFEDLEFYTGPEYHATTKGCRIPGIFIGGTVDRGCFPAPWIAEYHGSDLGAGTVENAVKNLDIWMRDIGQVKDHAPLSREGIVELLQGSSDPIEREFGLRFDRKYAFRAQGADWSGGDLFGTDGAPVMRFVRAKGVPSVVWESQANLVWDHLKHFRRDRETGRSIYDLIACWGER